MKKSLNRVDLIGRVGTDPELRYTSNGTAVVNLRIVTSEFRKDGDDYTEHTEWHNVVAWARTAEVIGEYVKKGERVYITGSLQTRSWEDRDGNTRYSTEIKVNDIIMLGGNRQQEEKPAQRQQPQPEAFEPDDDLPF